MIFTFTHPQYLFLLFAIPIFFIIHFYSIGNRKRKALNFANFNAIARIKGIDFFSKNIILLILNSLIALSLIFAVSGLTVQVMKEASSFSFVILIDTSESMGTNDFFPDRLTVAKQTAVDFVESSPFGSRFGIVSFSGDAYIEQDITHDKTEIINSINNIKIEGYGGTDLFEAIITSSKMLQDEELKAIVLLSDGQINVGTIEQIIDHSQKREVIIHSIAMGTLEGGNTTYQTISKLDEDFLKGVSYNTEGKYFLAEDKIALSESFQDILIKTQKKVSIKLTTYLVLLSIFLFFIEFLLMNTRYYNLI